MFYTSFITSLLPYLLLLGVFVTLWGDRLAFSHNTDGEEEKEVICQQKEAFEVASGSFFYSQEKNKNKETPENISTPRRFKPIEPLTNNKKFYLSRELPLVTNTGLNNTYSFRGPPS